jgi:hypothetical protein
MGGDEHASLTVKGGIHGAGHEKTLEIANLPAEKGLMPDLLLDDLPLIIREDQEIFVQLRDDELAVTLFRKDLPQPSGENYPSLAVYGVVILSPKYRHRMFPPQCSTSLHCGHYKGRHLVCQGKIVIFS